MHSIGRVEIETSMAQKDHTHWIDEFICIETVTDNIHKHTNAYISNNNVAIFHIYIII